MVVRRQREEGRVVSHWPPGLECAWLTQLRLSRLVERGCRPGVEALAMLCSQETSVHPREWDEIRWWCFDLVVPDGYCRQLDVRP